MTELNIWSGQQSFTYAHYTVRFFYKVQAIALCGYLFFLWLSHMRPKRSFSSCLTELCLFLRTAQAPPNIPFMLANSILKASFVDLYATFFSTVVKHYHHSHFQCCCRCPFLYPSFYSLSTRLSPSTNYSMPLATTLTFLLSAFLGPPKWGLNVSFFCPCNSCPYLTLLGVSWTHSYLRPEDFL